MNHTMGATMQVGESDATLDVAIKLRAILDAVYARDDDVRLSAARYLVEEGVALPASAPQISRAKASAIASALGR